MTRPHRAPTVGNVLLVPKRREKDIQTAILALLHARGVVAWKAGSGGFRVTDTHGRERYVKMGHTGVADIIGVFTRCLTGSFHGGDCLEKRRETHGTVGQFLAIEVKTDTGAVTPMQQAFLDSVRNAGGLAFVARSVDDVVKALGWDARSR